jgi:hypothetical protein
MSAYRSVNTPSRVHKTNLLMLYKAKVAVCSETRTEHIKQCEQHVEFFNFKPGGA